MLSLNKNEKVSYRFHAMGGPCELYFCFDDPKQLNNIYHSCEREVKRLERKYSRYIQDSIVSKINQSNGEPVEIDTETAGLIQYADTAYLQSDGLFDITSGVLREVWDFSKPEIPPAEKISAKVEGIGWEKVQWTARDITLPKGMHIDLGGIVKEYAADSVVSVALALGVSSGWVNLGGDISVVGPNLIEGKELPWSFGIRNPDDPEKAIATIDVFRGGLASSGDYERFFEIDGKRYCHILNPKTGHPCQGVAGVSILSANCLTAGTMATIAMLKGQDEGNKWLTDNEVEFLLFGRE